MEKFLKPKGSLNRREFLKACGQVVVVSASYEAISLVFNETSAHAAGDFRVPDEPLDPSLPMSFIEDNAGTATKSIQSDAERLRNYIRNKVEQRLNPRQPSAICGVRG